MKSQCYRFVLIAVFILKGCFSLAQNDAVKVRNNFNGEVYKSKSYFKFKYALLFIAAERFSSGKYETPNDTLVIADFRIGSSKPKKKLQENDTATCYIASKRGEQFRFSPLGIANVWINASTELRVKPLGELLDLKLHFGEMYVESPHHPITVHLTDSIKITGEAGSAFNLRRYDEYDRLLISLTKGRISVAAKETDGDSINIELPSGNEIILTRSNLRDVIHECDVDKIGIWRNGGCFYFDSEFLSSALVVLGRWYKTKVVYTKPVPEYQFTMTLPYTTPLDMALLYLSHVLPVKLSRRNDTIYVDHAVNTKK